MATWVQRPAVSQSANSSSESVNGREGAGQLLAPQDSARDDGLGVHIEAAGSGIENLHGRAPFWCGLSVGAGQANEFAMRAHRDGGNKRGCRSGSLVKLVFGLADGPSAPSTIRPFYAKAAAVTLHPRSDRFIKGGAAQLRGQLV